MFSHRLFCSDNSKRLLTITIISTLLLTAVISFTAIPLAYATEQVIDSNVITPQDYQLISNLHPSATGAASARGATFHTPTGNNYTLNAAAFRMRRYNSPVGDITAQVYAVTG